MTRSNEAREGPARRPTQPAEPHFVELGEAVEPVARRFSEAGLVVLSSIRKAELVSHALPGVVVRYVASGRERYRIGGKWHQLRADELMITDQIDEVSVVVGDGQRSPTAGLCLYFPDSAFVEQHLPLDGPIIIPAGSTAAGAAARSGLRQLVHSTCKQRDAAIVAQDVKHRLPLLAQQLARELAPLPHVRSFGRANAIRTLSFARQYLEAVVDRAVPLSELSRVAGISPYHLQRLFSAAFGTSPATYHRELRLRLVIEDSKARGLPLADSADRFGFAGGSSFSHAYRRAFGTAPTTGHPPQG